MMPDDESIPLRLQVPLAVYRQAKAAYERADVAYQRALGAMLQAGEVYLQAEEDYHRADPSARKNAASRSLSRVRA